jgi:hypothetical protein
MDHSDADRRFAKLVLLSCPSCNTTVLTIDIAVALVWCGACATSPLLERTTT